MKKISLIFIVLLFAVVFAPKAGAARITPSAEGRTSAIVTSPSPSVQSNKALDALKVKADKFVTTRVDLLQKLSDRIDKDKFLTTEDKTALKQKVADEIKKLNDLKTKIDGETTAQGVRDDAKLVLNEKIFAFFVPEVRLTVVIGNLSALEIKLEDLSKRIQGLIDNLKSEGKDVAKLQTALDDMNSKLKDIKGKLIADKTKLSSLASTGDFAAVFVAIRKDLAGVRADFAEIRADIAKMRKEIKIEAATGKKSTSPTPKSKL